MDIGLICENTPINDESKSLYLVIRINSVEKKWNTDTARVYAYVYACVYQSRKYSVWPISNYSEKKMPETHQQIKSSSINGQPHFISILIFWFFESFSTAHLCGTQFQCAYTHIMSVACILYIHVYLTGSQLNVDRYRYHLSYASMHLKFREKKNRPFTYRNERKQKWLDGKDVMETFYLRERHVCRRNSKNPSSQWQTLSTHALFATFNVHCSFNTQSLPSSWAVNE